MLLDGTFATERPAESARGPFQRIDRNPYVQLELPTFQIPAVQWHASEGPLPIDLNGQASRLSHLLLQKATFTDPLLLKEISIWRYTPLAALDSQRKKVTDNLGHWSLAFIFSTERSPTEPVYEVNMLLDGRLLNIVRDPSSPRSEILQ
jgi:hypothetical protein